MRHHQDDTITEQVNGNIPIKTQQRIEMALELFPDAHVEVLLADSEAKHEGRIKDVEQFFRCVETTKQRVKNKYSKVESATFFEKAGGMDEFMGLVEYFYKILRSKVRTRFEPANGREIDRKLSTLLEYQTAGTGGRLVGRSVNISPEVLAERILKNSFAEMLTIGEILRSVHSSLDGTCFAVVIFDQSDVTGLINSGEKHGTRLKHGISPLPLILANSATTV